jgi:hypothetical protein
VGELRAEALAAGIPDEDEIDGNGGGGGVGGGVGGGGDGERDPGHDLVEEERQNQQKPVDTRYSADEHPHDTIKNIFREELTGEAEVGLLSLPGVRLVAWTYWLSSIGCVLTYNNNVVKSANPRRR